MLNALVMVVEIICGSTILHPHIPLSVTQPPPNGTAFRQSIEVPCVN